MCPAGLSVSSMSVCRGHARSRCSALRGSDRFRQRCWKAHSRKRASLSPMDSWEQPSWSKPTARGRAIVAVLPEVMAWIEHKAKIPPVCQPIDSLSHATGQCCLTHDVLLQPHGCELNLSKPED